MRLGQLSRKINISTTEIASIIADEFELTIGEHPNIKIDDEHAEFIIAKFQINETDSLDAGSEIEEVGNEETNLKEDSETIVNVAEKNEISADPEEEEIETIRVESAKLEGLTVVDKIDLPPPPPPEMVEIDGVMYDKAELKKQRIAERKEREAQKRKDAAKRAADRKLRVQKSTNKGKKEVSLAEKRRLEDKNESDQKKQEERRKRYRQKKHYDSKHKIHKPASIKPEKKDKVKIEVEEVKVETRPESKSLLGKFWRWLNTY